MHPDGTSPEPGSSLTPPEHEAVSDEQADIRFPPSPAVAAGLDSPPTSPDLSAFKAPVGPPVHRRGPAPQPFVSVLVIIAALVAILGAAFSQNEEDLALLPPGVVPAEQDLGLVFFEMYSKALIGSGNTSAAVIERNVLNEAMLSDSPNVLQRLAILHVATDSGSEIAMVRALELLEQAEQLHHRYTRDHLDTNQLVMDHDDQWRRSNESLRIALTTPADELSSSDADFIRDEFGWFGAYLLTRDAGANNAERNSLFATARFKAISLVVLLLMLAMGVLAGFALFIVALVLIGTKRLRFKLQPQWLISRDSAAVYLEAFALYLGIVGVVSLAIWFGALNPWVGFPGIVLGSLVGVAWPYVRSRSAKRTSFELGFSCGRGVLREMTAGVLGYFACMPIIVAGIFATFVLATIWALLFPEEGPASPVAHPIVIPVIQGQWGTRLLVFALASGFAPFFEEFMFRGAFYGAMRTRMSIIVAAVIGAFVFAVIHPQGPIAVPALMGLAVSFALLREWRGSLIAPMIAHAMHNGMLVCLLIMMLG